ncbi:hypothetical protein [Enterobacter sp. CC120223-11]|uniref:hypothetical protein n=1 Tax=Enterobacter sp. CC120223-11 TaxID=1378073 RepID=UPI001142DC48|nr:hypothetical protein [Enterobacter sp. CC120223-11]
MNKDCDTHPVSQFGMGSILTFISTRLSLKIHDSFKPNEICTAISSKTAERSTSQMRISLAEWNQIKDDFGCMTDNGQVSATFVTRAIDPKHIDLDLIKGNSQVCGGCKSLIGFTLRKKSPANPRGVNV